MQQPVGLSKGWACRLQRERLILKSFFGTKKFLNQLCTNAPFFWRESAGDALWRDAGRLAAAVSRLPEFQQQRRVQLGLLDQKEVAVPAASAASHATCVTGVCSFTSSVRGRTGGTCCNPITGQRLPSCCFLTTWQPSKILRQF